MSQVPHIVFAGAATMDMIFAVDALPTAPGKVLPKAMIQAAHGMATSAAIAATRLGARTSLITRIGDDSMGDQFVAQVTAEGVDCEHIRRFEGVPTPLSAVIVDRSGERLILPYYDKGLRVDPDWIPETLIQSADAVQVDIRWPEAATKVLSLARGAGKIAVLDADTGPPEVILALAALASHTVFSAPAAMLVSGTDSVAAATRELTGRFAGFVGVTDGAQGCFWLENGSLHNLLPPAVDVVDTLAAGDVFHGAFTLALAESRSIPEAVAFANAAAALKCTVFGGRLGSPNRASVLRCLAQGL
ncbi:PfkB family carbohydrate kinase [Devosia sp. 1566]|uniref:PfkB family carbohydrate kinase n=1 Tax=Devosia sp. 1566 TaxID=2499144 RepID=UPI000FD92BB9|nr:PfkB family carbohydrate kinase [Devosia sp. 1566]